MRVMVPPMADVAGVMRAAIVLGCCVVHRCHSSHSRSRLGRRRSWHSHDEARKHCNYQKQFRKSIHPSSPAEKDALPGYIQSQPSRIVAVENAGSCVPIGVIAKLGENAEASGDAQGS